MKLKRNKIVLLAALGLIPAVDALGGDHEPVVNINTDDPRAIAESLQVNVDTIRVLEMFSQMGALNFDNEIQQVYISPDHLPNALIEKLHDSDEVEFDEDSDRFVLKDVFVNTLAKNHAFSRLGTITSIKSNDEILKRLKENSTPVLREDQLMYSRHSFIR